PPPGCRAGPAPRPPPSAPPGPCPGTPAAAAPPRGRPPSGRGPRRPPAGPPRPGTAAAGPASALSTSRTWHAHPSDQPDLAQHRGVVPVDALARQLVAAELHHHHHVDVHGLVRRLDARQEPVHPLAVREAEAQLVHELALAEDAVDR